MYKRFMRWASDRLADDGVIGFITNRAYLDTKQDDGFRRIITEEFTDVYVLDLGSDVRRNPKISGTTHNVFGIQTGVAIAFFVRDKSKRNSCNIHYARREDAELAAEKLSYLRGADLQSMEFEDIVPDSKSYWLQQSDSDFDKLSPLADNHEEAIFSLHTPGVVTARDEWVYDFSPGNLNAKVRFFADAYNGFLDAADESYDPVIKWSRNLRRHFQGGRRIHFEEAKIVTCQFRPFVRKWYFADAVMNNDLTGNHYRMFGSNVKAENQVICVKGPTAEHFSALVSSEIVDFKFGFTGNGGTFCLPLYRYTPDGERVSNITEWGLRRINDHYRQEWGAGFDERYPDGIGAEDIFAYTYAVLHDPVYRHDYRVDLLREFPRLPFYHDFDHWARMGQELLDLHLGFETADPYPLERVDVDSRVRGNDGGRAILRADRERGVITLDEHTKLTGVPADAFRYQLGSRSALEWVLDQYKERKPRDPTIRERFNTYRFADHKERVIDLLRRVCTVSVKTMAVVDSMAHRQPSESGLPTSEDYQD